MSKTNGESGFHQHGCTQLTRSEKVFHETVLKGVAMSLNLVEHFCLTDRQRILNIVASHGAVPLPFSCIMFFFLFFFFPSQRGLYNMLPNVFSFFFNASIFFYL